MKYHEYQPKHPLLCSHIEYYNSMEGEGLHGKKFISLPEGKIGLVFFLSGHTLIDTENIITRRHQSHIWGLIQKPNFVKISPDILTFCVVFKPGGLAHFLPPHPLTEIAKASASLPDIYGKEIKRIEDALYECKTFQQRIQIIEPFLIQQLNAPLVRIQKAVQLIENQKGNISVSNLSNYLNLSTRQLRNIFRESVGLSPKQFIRMMRFKNTLSSPPSSHENMAQYANRMGYYDESHFIYEFKTLAGMTPRKYFQNLSFISDFSNFKRLMLE